MRSTLEVIAVMVTSKLPACRAGMMPSKACCSNSKSMPSFAPMAWPRSTSTPVSLVGALSVNISNGA